MLDYISNFHLPLTRVECRFPGQKGIASGKGNTFVKKDCSQIKGLHSCLGNPLRVFVCFGVKIMISTGVLEIVPAEIDGDLK